MRPLPPSPIGGHHAAVTNEEFEALVGRLEGEAKRSPGGYKTRVVLMALLGNAYLGLMLVLIAALLLAAVVSIAWLKGAGVKIAFVVGVFLWMVLKALWIRLEPPQGSEVSARDAPELFAMIEELRRALHAPRFHHVLVGRVDRRRHSNEKREGKRASERVTTYVERAGRGREAFPALVLALGITAALGASLTNVMIAIAIVYMPAFARLVRSEALSVREREFVTAAHTIGVRPLRIMMTHILPNVAASIIVMASLRVAQAMITEAGMFHCRPTAWAVGAILARKLSTWLSQVIIPIYPQDYDITR
jgi:hypothetical protein